VLEIVIPALLENIVLNREHHRRQPVSHVGMRIIIVLQDLSKCVVGPHFLVLTHSSVKMASIVKTVQFVRKASTVMPEKSTPVLPEGR
jgi:hypothetical protein